MPAPSYTLKIADSGRVLVLEADAPIASLDTSGISLTIDGVTVPTGPPIYGARRPDETGNPTAAPYDPSALWMLGVDVPPSAVVRFSAPAGFLATASGPADAAVNLPVDNPGTIASTWSGTPTMPVGWNTEGLNSYQPGQDRSNYATRINVAQTPGTVRDARGYPTRIPYQQIGYAVATAYPDPTGTPRSSRNTIPGEWTLIHRGASAARLGGGTKVVVDGDGNSYDVDDCTLLRTSTQSDGRTRSVYQINESVYHGPPINLYVVGTAQNGDGSYQADISDVEIYPPNPDTGLEWIDPPYWLPSFRTQFGRGSCMRVLDKLPINGSNVVNLSDLFPDDYFGFGGSYKDDITAPIAHIRAYSGTDDYFVRQNRILIQVETTSPHSFLSGMTVKLGGDQPNDVGTVEWAAGGHTDSFSISGITGPVRVIDATTFVVQLYPGNYDAVMTNVLSPASALARVTPGGATYAGGNSLGDIVRACNDLGCDLHINVPHLLTPEGRTELFTYIAVHLNASLRCFVEYSNECWNFGFVQSLYCSGESRMTLEASYQEWVPWYVLQSALTHKAARAAFVAAGADPGRIVAVYNTDPATQYNLSGTDYLLKMIIGTPVNPLPPASNPSVSTYRTDYPAIDAERPIRADRIAISTYLDNTYLGPASSYEPSQQALYEQIAADPGACVDLMSLTMKNGGYPRQAEGLAAKIAAAGFAGTAPLPMAYEGGYQRMIPAWWTMDDATAHVHEAAVARHWAAHVPIRIMLRAWQDAGFAQVNIFYLAGGNVGYGGGQWGTFPGAYTLPASGNPAIDKITNADPADLFNVRSPAGGEIDRWNQVRTESPDNPIGNSGSGSAVLGRITGSGSGSSGSAGNSGSGSGTFGPIAGRGKDAHVVPGVLPTFGLGYWSFAYFGGSRPTIDYFSSNYALSSSFLAAINSVLISDPELRQLVPGGFGHRESPPGLPYPKGTFSAISGQNERIATGPEAPYIESGQLQFAVYGPNPGQVRRAANRITRLFTRELPYLFWRKGRLMYLTLSNPASPAAPTQGTGAAAIEGEMRLFDYQISGEY